MRFSKTAITHSYLYLLINFLCWAVYVLLYSAESVNILGFVFTSAFVLINYLEYRKSGKLFFTQPPAYFSLFMFFYIYLSFFLVQYFESQLSLFDSTGIDPSYYIKTLLITNIASSALWIGFRLLPHLSLPIDKLGVASIVRRKYIYIIIILAIIANLIGIKTGAIGFVNRSEDAVNQTASFVQYIRILMDLSYLGFVILVWFYYDIKKYRPLIYIVFTVLFLLGLLVGSKSVSVFYAIYFGLVIYFKSFSINYKYILVFVFGVFIAYSIIEPFRNFYGRTGRSFATTDVFELISFYQKALSYSQQQEDNSTAIIGIYFLSRISYTIPLARSMKYAEDNNHYLPPSYSTKHILLSPAYSFIPRFLWNSKPFADFSIWVGKEVMKIDERARVAIGITPQGYAYMAGGILMIILIFLLIGNLQGVFYNTFYKNPNYIPFYIFFLLKIHTPDQLLWASFSSLTRSMLIYFIVYYIISTKFRLQRGK